MREFKRWALVAVVAVSIALAGCVYKKVEVRHEKTMEHGVYQHHDDEHHGGPARHEKGERREEGERR